MTPLPKKVYDVPCADSQFQLTDFIILQEGPMKEEGS